MQETSFQHNASRFRIEVILVMIIALISCFKDPVVRKRKKNRGKRNERSIPKNN